MPALIIRLKRMWRCPELDCPAGTWTEEQRLIAPRGVLTSRAITWATDAPPHDDTTVAVLARHLRVDEHARGGPSRPKRLGAPAARIYCSPRRPPTSCERSTPSPPASGSMPTTTWLMRPRLRESRRLRAATASCARRRRRSAPGVLHARERGPWPTIWPASSCPLLPGGAQFPSDAH
jgi:hypothetical protein